MPSSSRSNVYASFIRNSPSPQEPEAGPELVSVLPLDLVQVHRQVPVRGELCRDEPRDDLLLRRSEEHLAVVPVRQPEQRVPVQIPATGRLPWLGREQDRHPDLLRPGPVHLLANDPLDPADRSEPERQRHVDAGGHLADVGGPKQQLV